jgi:hypothetical protein
LNLPAVPVGAERKQIVQVVRGMAQGWFSDEVLFKVRDIIKSVRLGKGFGNYLDCLPVPMGGSGLMAIYSMDGQPMSEQELGVMMNQRTQGDAYVRVVGGQYKNKRIDVDFGFGLCVAARTQQGTLVGWIGFHFWLVSDASNPKRLVLRVRSPLKYSAEAVGALLTVFIDRGNVLLGGNGEKYKGGHIRELYLEFQPPRAPNGIGEADMQLEERAKALVAVVKGEVGTDVILKAFRVFGKSIENNVQRIQAKYYGTL